MPAGAVLQCFANYGGDTHHHYWVMDPSRPPNPRRAVHLAFDDKLEILLETLNKSYAKGRDARDFEIGVAWLLWMLGFSITPMGGMPKTANAPDLIASTPQGHIAVIECTTGLLKADNKLSLLVERTEKVRKSLAGSGNSYPRILPIVVTTKTRDEVKADLDQAYKLGVLVITREAFDNAVSRSLILPNADQLFAEAEAELKRAQLGVSQLDPSVK